MKATHGTLNLVFRKHGNGKTFLASQHYRLPLQVLTPYYPDGDGTAFVYLLNPSGGILQGDLLETEILVEEEARCCVTTPSANKFYRMDEGAATLRNNIRVQAGGVLEYLPEYNIPFAESSVVQTTDITLDPEATLLAFDMVVPGRMEKGEFFQYTKYLAKTSIRIGKTPVAVEAIRLEPDVMKPSRLGLLEGHGIYGTVYLYQKGLPGGLKDQIDGFLQAQPRVSGGMTFLSPDLAGVKLLGDSVQECRDAMDGIWDLARRAMLGKKAGRMRKY